MKDQTFDGPFIKSIPEARDFIASQLRDYQFQTHGTMEFRTVPEYPEYPWFEGLVNAITHRDYSIYGEYVRVYIFDDRMLIQSPGKLLVLSRLRTSGTNDSLVTRSSRAFLLLSIGSES